MKRFLGVLSLSAAVVLAVFTIAIAAEEKKAEETAKPVTITGEIIDTGCYMAHGAAGEKHKACGATCVAAGMPMGLLTEKGVLYLVTQPHENKDAYNKMKAWVGDKAEVTGMVYERGGMKSIEVASAKQAAAPAPAK
jgi:hypothetical protein